MKVALASLAVIGFAAAQDLTGIPTCALGCITQVIPGSACSLTDVDCFCNAVKQAQIQNLAGKCLNKECTADELTQAANATKSFCAQLTSTTSATVTVTAGASSSASSSSASTTGTHASNSTVSTSSTSSANSTSTGYHNSTTVSTATKTSSTGDLTATITTTTTQTPTKTPNAAAGTAVGALFAVVAFAFAL